MSKQMTTMSHSICTLHKPRLDLIFLKVTPAQNWSDQDIIKVDTFK